jgi:hypothetical protein
VNDHPPARKVRVRLRRHDGRIFLDRWGIEAEKIGGIFVHRMTAPDPGIDLHDHPWTFWSLVLWGGYTEERAPTRLAVEQARYAAEWPNSCTPGTPSWRRRLTVKAVRLDEAHRITHLHKPTVWTVVVHGPTRRQWGFYLPTGWVDEHTYDRTVRVNRRDLWNEKVR